MFFACAWLRIDGRECGKEESQESGGETRGEEACCQARGKEARGQEGHQATSGQEGHRAAGCEACHREARDQARHHRSRAQRADGRRRRFGVVASSVACHPPPLQAGCDTPVGTVARSAGRHVGRSQDPVRLISKPSTPCSQHPAKRRGRGSKTRHGSDEGDPRRASAPWMSIAIITRPTQMRSPGGGRHRRLEFGPGTPEYPEPNDLATVHADRVGDTDHCENRSANEHDRGISRASCQTASEPLHR